LYISLRLSTVTVLGFFATVQLVFAGTDSQGLRYGTVTTKEEFFVQWKAANATSLSGGVLLNRRSMKNYTVCHSVTAAFAAAKSKLKSSGSLLKIGVDIHRENFVSVAQYDQATPSFAWFICAPRPAA
jgi:hypothetical protein